MESGDAWVECKDTRHGVGSPGGRVWFKCDFAFKIGKDVSRRERMEYLDQLFNAMVEQVDEAFGEVWAERGFQHGSDYKAQRKLEDEAL